jgi:hypothetical protein
MLRSGPGKNEWPRHRLEITDGGTPLFPVDSPHGKRDGAPETTAALV